MQWDPLFYSFLTFDFWVSNFYLKENEVEFLFEYLQHNTPPPPPHTQFYLPIPTDFSGDLGTH